MAQRKTVYTKLRVGLKKQMSKDQDMPASFQGESGGESGNQALIVPGPCLSCGHPLLLTFFLPLPSPSGNPQTGPTERGTPAKRCAISRGF